MRPIILYAKRHPPIIDKQTAGRN